MGGVAVLPSGGLFGKKKDDKDKENRDANITPERNGTEPESQLNAAIIDKDKSPQDKKERSKVSNNVNLKRNKKFMM